MKSIKKIFKYIEPMWIGKDNKLSLRSAGAIALLIDFIINVHNSASFAIKVLNLVYKEKTIDYNLIAAMSGNFAQIVLILGIEAGLIAALLALKTYQPSYYGNQFTNFTAQQPPSQPIEQVH